MPITFISLTYSALASPWPEEVAVVVVVEVDVDVEVEVVAVVA
jgi:hypothetical protein